MNKEVVEQQDNVVTTKDKYNRVIKRSIILCWIALAICFIVKIFGGNFFEIVVHNDRFTAVCEFCQKSFILTNIVFIFLVVFVRFYILTLYVLHVA